MVLQAYGVTRQSSFICFIKGSHHTTTNIKKKWLNDWMFFPGKNWEINDHSAENLLTKKQSQTWLLSHIFISTSISIKHPKMLKQQLITTLIKILDSVERVFVYYNMPVSACFIWTSKNEINQFRCVNFALWLLMKYLVSKRSECMRSGCAYNTYMYS